MQNDDLERFLNESYNFDEVQTRLNQARFNLLNERNSFENRKPLWKFSTFDPMINVINTIKLLADYPEKIKKLNEQKKLLGYFRNDLFIFNPVTDVEKSKDLYSLGAALEIFQKNSQNNVHIKDGQDNQYPKTKKLIFPLLQRHYNRNHWVTVIFELEKKEVTLVDSRPIYSSAFYPNDQIKNALGATKLKLVYQGVQNKSQDKHFGSASWTMANINEITSNSWFEPDSEPYKLYLQRSRNHYEQLMLDQVDNNEEILVGKQAKEGKYLTVKKFWPENLSFAPRYQRIVPPLSWPVIFATFVILTGITAGIIIAAGGIAALPLIGTLVAWKIPALIGISSIITTGAMLLAKGALKIGSWFRQREFKKITAINAANKRHLILEPDDQDHLDQFKKINKSLSNKSNVANYLADLQRPLINEEEKFNKESKLNGLEKGEPAKIEELLFSSESIPMTDKQEEIEEEINKQCSR